LTIAECPYVHLNGGKALIYDIVALDNKRRFMILFEKQKGGQHVEYIRASQGHSVPLTMQDMYDVESPLPEHVGCATHASLMYNLNSIVRHGLKLGTDHEGGRLCLHLLPNTPDTPEFAQRQQHRFRDMAVTADLDKLKTLGYNVAMSASGAVVVDVGLSSLIVVPMTAVVAFWRVYYEYEPVVLSKDSYDYYVALNQSMVEQ